MLSVEKRISNYQHSSPWSPEIYIVTRRVFLWKLVLPQTKTKVSHRKQIDKLQKILREPIDFTLKYTSDIFNQLNIAKQNLEKQEKKNIQQQTNYLLLRASAMYIANKKPYQILSQT